MDKAITLFRGGQMWDTAHVGRPPPHQPRRRDDASPAAITLHAAMG